MTNDYLDVFVSIDCRRHLDNSSTFTTSIPFRWLNWEKEPNPAALWRSRYIKVWSCVLRKDLKTINSVKQETSHCLWMLYYCWIDQNWKILSVSSQTICFPVLSCHSKHIFWPLKLLHPLLAVCKGRKTGLYNETEKLVSRWCHMLRAESWKNNFLFRYSYIWDNA